MDKAGSPSQWRIVEDVPQCLGIAVGVRFALGFPHEFAAAVPRHTPPSRPASDEAMWHAWWSYLVTLRSPNYAARQSEYDLVQMAGDFMPLAMDWFAERKFDIVKAARMKPLAATDVWKNAGSRRGAASLSIDVIPGDFPMSQRVSPGYWVMTVQSRTDAKALNELLIAEL